MLNKDLVFKQSTIQFDRMMMDEFVQNIKKNNPDVVMLGPRGLL